MGDGSAPPELVPLLVCRFMHWSWLEMNATPDYIIEDILVWLQQRGVAGKVKEARRKAKERRY